MNSICALTLRREPEGRDRESIREILLSTGVFYHFEIEVALELIDDRLSKGEGSEYHFIFAESDGEPVGFICYGPITMTEHRFDIYWIAVRKDMQGMGIGSLLLTEAEGDMRRLGCSLIFVETSSRQVYEPTRGFYRRSGFREVARIPDFYAAGDDKVVFMKSLLNTPF